MQDPKKLLVDVIQLSKIRCKKPIQGDLKYASRENFVGQIIAGYAPDARDVCLLTHTPAEMLCKVQDYLISNYHYGLLILDAYRPLHVVKYWAEWFKQPPADDYELERKKIHYPHLEKKQLAELGYVADVVSKHCFGATVDLVLIDEHGKELAMGACFDFFDELAHPDAPAEKIGEQAVKNRQILAEAMQRYGFHPYCKEYWHFDHEKVEVTEPLDIAITSDLRGIGVNS
jgi:D-alanyl-D-alanine dipeptidase